MVRPSKCLPLLFGAALLSCIVDHPVREFSPALFDDQARPSLGYFKHRGTMYNLHNLMDPQFRSSHRDPHVREFNPNVWFGHRPMRMDTLMDQVWADTDVLFETIMIPPEQPFNPAEEATQSFELEP